MSGPFTPPRSHFPRRRPVSLSPFTTTSIDSDSGSPSRKRIAIMSLNPEPADVGERSQAGLPPKTFADAVNEASPDAANGENIRDYEGVNEELIKETPPRFNHSRSGSEPRPLGEVMDDMDLGIPPSSPSLRHPRGRLEEVASNGESYADAVQQSPSAHESASLASMPPGLWLAQKRKADGQADDTELGSVKTPLQNGVAAPEAYEAIGSDDSPKSPARRAQRKRSSKDFQSSPKQRPTSHSNNKANGTAEQQNGDLVYENIMNKSGENLASIKPDPQLYDLALSQSESRDVATQSTSEERNVQRRNSELVSGRRAGAGWQRSAIRWAPMNIPLQRRLQTLLVLLHTLSIAGGFALFFMLCTIPLLWPILLPYLIYVLFSTAHLSGELSHRSPRLKGLRIWSLFASYFPARLHRSAELEPTRKYVFGYHPHGIISHGAFAAFATEALGFSQLFPGITNTLLTLESNFRIPIYRDYALRMGLASVSRESCENILSKGGPNGEGMGRAITIVVGGARESLDAKPGQLRLVLRRRKGFVKLAIRTGADLVPVLAFGENDLYEQLDTEQHPWVHRFQLGVKKIMGFTVPLFHARGVFNYDVGLMPYRRPINIVVGKPIRILQSSKPDAAYIDSIHEQYCNELLRLWDEWKDTFAHSRTGELEVVE